MQGAVDGLMKQISALAAPGSRICFDALHRDHMDGRVRNRGFSCGVEVRARAHACALYFVGRPSWSALAVAVFMRRWHLTALLITGHAALPVGLQSPAASAAWSTESCASCM